MIPEDLIELRKVVGPDATRYLIWCFPSSPIFWCYALVFFLCENYRMDLVSAFLLLLYDDDDEVRRAAAGQLNLFCQI